MQNLSNVQLSISTETKGSTYTDVQLIAHRLIKLEAGTTKDKCKRSELLHEEVSPTDSVNPGQPDYRAGISFSFACCRFIAY